VSEHLEGRQHGHMLAVWRARALRGISMDDPSLPSWALPGCDLCGVKSFSAPINEQQHYDGARHAQRVSEREEEQRREEEERREQERWEASQRRRNDAVRAHIGAHGLWSGCAKCGVAEFTSDTHRDQHEMGARHRTNRASQYAWAESLY